MFLCSLSFLSTFAFKSSLSDIKVALPVCLEYVFLSIDPEIMSVLDVKMCFLEAAEVS